MLVKRTEQIWLKPDKMLSRLCHLSKNLYNEANYLIKQALENKEIEKRRWLRYYELYHLLKTSPNYHALPAQSAQQTLKLIDRSWKAFFKAIKEWKKDPKKFKKKPNPPKYKPKNGEYILIFTNQQVRIQRNHLIFPKKVGLEVKTRLPEDTDIREVRIIPKGVCFVLELVYNKEISPKVIDPHRVAAIDLGVRNLVTLVNNIGKKPIVIKGGIAKSINQYYNKEKARLQQIYDYQGVKTGKKLLKMIGKRNQKLHDLFHKISRFIVKWCLNHNIGILVIGYNERWKQGVNMGCQNNQNFVSLLYHKLIHQLNYKAVEAGIKVVCLKESHTSKCSSLDLEPIKHHTTYAGKRISRGLFRSANGMVINADVNAAYNILRKAVPKAFDVDGIEGVGLHPEKSHSIFQRFS